MYIKVSDSNVFTVFQIISPFSLILGNASMGPARQGKSKREQELEKLVQQAYDQLRRLKESKKGKF